MFTSTIHRLNTFLNAADSIVNLSLTRAAATAATRIINPSDPISWGFCGFSQSNEDGIIDYLTRNLIKPDYYFIEIGAGNGISNNTAWLAIARKYSGIMIDGSSSILHGKKLISPYLSGNVEFVQLFIDSENINGIKEMALVHNPDVFSLDIDGNDFYIAEKLFKIGIRPKIFVVEYNAVYGPHKNITIKYDPGFQLSHDHKNPNAHFYHGVSISAWRKFFLKHGYKFVTVEENGVNAFFIDPAEFKNAFTEAITPLDFRDNYYQVANFKMGWEDRFKYIADKPFHHVD